MLLHPPEGSPKTRLNTGDRMGMLSCIRKENHFQLILQHAAYHHALSHVPCGDRRRRHTATQGQLGRQRPSQVHICVHLSPV